MIAYWDLLSLILYLSMAFTGCLLFKKNHITVQKGNSIFTQYSIVWIIIWTLFASFRHVETNIGGADAIAYRIAFENALDETQSMTFAHYDILYQWFCILIRHITSNYHIYFIVVYAFLSISYFVFVEEYTPKETNYIPFILIFFIFLRGFNTIRTNLAAALIMFGLVALKKKRNVIAILLVVSAVLMHKASIIYSLIVPFYLFYSKKRLSIKSGILLSALSFVIGGYAQKILLGSFGIWLGDAYSAYARRSLSASFFDGFWKIAFGQLLLAIMIIIFRKSIRLDIENRNEDERKSLDMIWQFCMYDFIMIPLTFVLCIWRGYEYLYLARLIMWSEIACVVQRQLSYKAKQILNFVLVLGFVSWLVFRINSTWYDSKLMPYVFSWFGD